MRKANKKEIRKLKRESARREIDRLVDSLDFEPVNFNEKVECSYSKSWLKIWKRPK